MLCTDITLCKRIIMLFLQQDDVDLDNNYDGEDF